jgi:hypothetical protein
MNTVSESDKKDWETPMLVILKGYHLSLREHASAAIDDNQRVLEKNTIKNTHCLFAKASGNMRALQMAKTI